jgi:transposase
MLTINGEEITEEFLQGLDKQTLIQINLQLAIRLDELERKINKPKKNSSNSSVPPSKDESSRYPKRKPSLNKPGAQIGHKGKTRKWNEHPDKIITLTPDQCNNCGGQLQGTGTCIEKRQLIDIPSIQPITIEYHRQEIICQNCQTANKGSFPKSVYSTIAFGHNLQVFTSLFFHGNYGSYERTQQFLADICKLQLSQGAIGSILKKIDTRLIPVIERITNRIKTGEQIGSDETQTKINKQKHWNWIYQNPKDVLIKVYPKRDWEAIKQTIGEIFNGTWISDRYNAQLKIQVLMRQICLAHLLRDTQYLIEAERTKAAYQYQQILYKIIHVWNRWYRQESIEKTEQKIYIIEQLYKQLIKVHQQGIGAKQKHTHTFFKQLWKSRNYILTCLKQGVPFHNNDSERPLRHIKNQLKISGFRSLAGAEQYANFMSVYHTARRRKLSVYDTFSAFLR